MPTLATKNLESRLERRQLANIRRSELAVRAVDKLYHNAWRELLGLLGQIEASGKPPVGAMQQSIRALLYELMGDSIAKIKGELRTVANKAYEDTANDLIRSLPREAWIRMAKRNIGIREGDSSLIQRAKAAAIRVLKGFSQILPDFQAIIDGEDLPVDGWRAMLKRVLFPPPPKAKVDEILRSDRWPDRKSWPQRLQQEGFSFDQIVNQVTVGFSQGEGIPAIRKRIEPLVNNVRFRATRIARTESLKVASAMQKESFDKVDSMIIGYKAITMDDERVRPEHQVWHNRVYWKPGHGDGSFDISELPEFPAAPNCRCIAVPLFAGIDE